MRIAVLMTCHNRREQTVRCLERLQAQGFPFAEPGNRAVGTEPGSSTRLSVFLVDDGSTDGTGETVRARFPAVQVIAGDGKLYWCGGMRRAWAEATIGDFDAYWWVNDDTMVYPGTLDALVQIAGASSPHHNDRQESMVAGFASKLPAIIVVGSTCDPESKEPTYGVLGPDGPSPPPSGDAVRCRSFNGNLVLVTREAYRRLGNFRDCFTHGIGDVDYAARANRAGIPILVAPGFLGECRRNQTPAWSRADVPLRIRWKEMHGPKGCPPHEYKHFRKELDGWKWPLAMAKLYAQVLAPGFWRMIKRRSKS